MFNKPAVYQTAGAYMHTKQGGTDHLRGKAVTQKRPVGSRDSILMVVIFVVYSSHVLFVKSVGEIPWPPALGGIPEHTKSLINILKSTFRVSCADVRFSIEVTMLSNIFLPRNGFKSSLICWI